MSKVFFKQDVLAQNGPFFIGLFLYIFIGCGLEEYYGKDELHLLINQFHTPYGDALFKFLTQWSIPIMGLLSLAICVKYFDYKRLFYLVIAFLLNTLIILFVKRTFFEHGLRPSEYFYQKGVELQLIEGVSNQITYTFPSGHSSNIFLLMLFISMIVPKKGWKLVFFIIAALVAFSRVYLSKHFLIDTVAGAILGVFSNLLIYYIFRNVHSKALDKKII